MEQKIRRIDELGRIVVPIEMRNYLEIKTGDKIDIFKSGKNIILKKSKNIEKQLKHITIDKGIEVDIQITYLKNNSTSNCYTRSINELGMVVIPLELRKNLDINEKAKMRMCIKDDYIILIKERCSFGRNNKNFNHNKRKEQCRSIKCG